MRITTLLWFAIVGTALYGCSKHSPVQPAPVSELPPNLKAYEGTIYWPDIPIGGMTAASPRTGPDALANHETNQVVAGTGALPLVRQVCAGSFPDYQIHFYVNDELWWDRASSTTAPVGAHLWLGIYGMMWVPPDTGTYVIRIVLDATNRYQESDETDNEVSFKVRVIPPDLVAGMLEVIEWRNGYPYRVNSVTAGTPVQVVAWSFARGPFANHRAVLEGPDGVMLDHRATLAGGTIFPDIRQDTVACTPRIPGTSQFRYVVDPDGNFFDGNRANNTAIMDLTVLPAAATR